VGDTAWCDRAAVDYLYFKRGWEGAGGKSILFYYTIVYKRATSTRIDEGFKIDLFVGVFYMQGDVDD
jgi:hypothetical protein